MKILTEEAEQWNGYGVYALEENLEENLTAVLLRGRVDRIMQNPDDGSLIVLDYKTGALPGARDILGSLIEVLKSLREEPEGLPGALKSLGEEQKAGNSVQLPAYSLLLKTAGETVCEAGYYSLKKGVQKRYQPVLKREADYSTRSKLPVQHPEVLDMLEQSVMEQLLLMHQRISEGDLRIPARGCSSCVSKAICRHRFALRMRGE